MSGFRRNKKGAALLEVLIAGVILAVVLVGFMQGLNVTLLGTDRDSKMNSVQHIAQSQMEYIKSLPFNNSACEESTSPPYAKIHDLPENYNVEVTVDPDPYWGNCSTLQLIMVTVSYNSTNLASQDYRVVLKDYKIDR
jgi:Tfp pilus assembly protein PilV